MNFRFRDLPLRRKLYIALLLPAGIAIIVLFALMILNTVYQLRKELVSEISVLTQVTAINSAAAVVFNDPKSATETLAALRVKPEIKVAEISDNRGRILASYRNAGVSSEFDIADANRDRLWDPVFSTSRLIVVDKKTVGHVLIVANLTPQLWAVADQLLPLLFASLVSLVLILLIANRFRHMIATPIEQVAGTANAIASDQDYSRRVPPTAGADEVGQLVKAFNHMVKQIEDRELRLREELQQRQIAEQKLEHLAHYDTLTGLPNRYLFQQTLALTLERTRNLGHQAALFFVDVDNFKLVNDSLGHPTGDMLLKILSQRLVQCMRGSDIVSRPGGDEFTIIIDQVKGMEYLRAIADKLAMAAAQPIKLNDFEFQTTVSIGIALFPDDAVDAETLVRNADTAMYFAKSRGRANFQFYSREMNERANNRLVVEALLRRALEKNELFLLYQPQIDFATGRIVGVEALVRWNSPELGMVGPQDFIQVAEETGLIQHIGDFVLEEACRQTKSWADDEGVSLRIAVNVSIRQFNAKLFIDNIQSILARTGLALEFLELELTESCLMDNVEDTLNKIRKLHDLGIRLSIDDFGTGYSSMAYLRQLPISQLKVDQSFVHNIPGIREDMEIVRAILLLARGLNLETLAEGVETAEQASFLAGESCAIAQGYYFSRPVPADEITTLVRQQKIYSW